MITTSKSYRVDVYEALAAEDLQKHHPATLIYTRRCRWISATIWDASLRGHSQEDIDDEDDAIVARLIKAALSEAVRATTFVWVEAVPGE